MDLRLAHFVAVTPAVVTRLRGDPEAAVALREGPRDETSLDRYWHGVQFLLAGRAKGVRGPLAWLTGGGEKLGRTAGGPIRYLSPEQVRELSTALDDVEPDDLGDGLYDEAAMDAAGVYPGSWVRDGRDADLLSTLRELYSYLRDFLAAQRKARKGVVIVMSVEPGLDEAEDDEADDAVPPEPAPAAPPPGQAEVLLVGANGRRYDRAAAGPRAELDATLAGLGYRPLGDLAVLPILAGLCVRAYRSEDGTAVAAVVLNGAKVASTTFLAPLEKDALVVTSDALVLAKVKRRLFATTRSGATPAALEAALREQRAACEKKHGPPSVVPATLAAAAGVWEAWWVKREG